MENLIVLILAFLPFDDVNRTGLRNYIFHIFEVHADRKCLFADLKGLEVTAGAIDFYVIFFLFYDWHIVVVMPKFVLFLNIFQGEFSFVDYEIFYVALYLLHRRTLNILSSLKRLLKMTVSADFVAIF